MTIIQTVTGNLSNMINDTIRLTERSEPRDMSRMHNYFHSSMEVVPVFGNSSPLSTYWRERDLWSDGYFPWPVLSGTTVKVVNMPSNAQYYDRLYSEAYEKLVRRTKRGALELGLNIAEARSTMSMMLTRLNQLTMAAHALRRGKFLQFLQLLGLHSYGGTGRKPRIKRNLSSDDFAKLWLEYWMGWAPLVSDVTTLLGRLVTPYNKAYVSAGAKTPWESRSYSGSSGAYSYHTEQRSRIKLRIGFLLEYEDEAAYSSWDDGLNNLASIAWGATPMSFLADWFVNIDQLIGSMTDFGGVVFKDGFISLKREYESVHTWPTFNGPANAFSRKKNGRVYARKRITTPPVPNLVFTPIPDYTLPRLLTAVSLFRSVVLKNARF